MNKTLLLLIVALASLLVTCLAAKPKMRLSEASMLMGEREEDDLEPKRAVSSKTKENAEAEGGLYRGYPVPGWGWPHYPTINAKPIRPVVNPWPGLGALGGYGAPGLGLGGLGGLGGWGGGWGGWGFGRPGLFGWLF